MSQCLSDGQIKAYATGVAPDDQRALAEAHLHGCEKCRQASQAIGDVGRGVTDATRATLLMRVRDSKDTDAWREFHDLYSRLIYKYARRRGLGREDAQDVRSKCLEELVVKMPNFEYQKEKGGFKALLKRMVNCRVTDLFRKRRELPADSQAMRLVEDPGPEPDEIWETQWRHQHLRYCVEQIRDQVSTRNFEAFTMLVLKEATVEDVCDELGMNPNQVYKSKSRVLKRVREKLDEIGYEGT